MNGKKKIKSKRRDINDWKISVFVHSALSQTKFTRAQARARARTDTHIQTHAYRHRHRH